MILGVGCRRDADPGPLLAWAQELGSLFGQPFASIASIDRKHDEKALDLLASTLGVPFRLFAPATLLAQTPHLTHRSTRIFDLTGCWGVAESAALAAAGAGGRLVMPRRVRGPATAAIAAAAP